MFNRNIRFWYHVALVGDGVLLALALLANVVWIDATWPKVIGGIVGLVVIADLVWARPKAKALVEGG